MPVLALQSRQWNWLSDLDMKTKKQEKRLKRIIFSLKNCSFYGFFRSNITSVSTLTLSSHKILRTKAPSLYIGKLNSIDFRIWEVPSSFAYICTCYKRSIHLYLTSIEHLRKNYIIKYSPKLSPCVCVVVSQIKAKVNGKKYSLKQLYILSRVRLDYELSSFFMLTQYFCPLSLTFVGRNIKLYNSGFSPWYLAPAARLNNNFGGIQKMKKVVYGVSRYVKGEISKLTGIGYITDTDLVIACMSKKGTPYTRVFEDCIKDCHSIPNRDNISNSSPSSSLIRSANSLSDCSISLSTSSIVTLYFFVSALIAPSNALTMESGKL